MINDIFFEEYDNSDEDTMPILLNIWELDDSSDDGIYDDSIPGYLNRCKLDD